MRNFENSRYVGLIIDNKFEGDGKVYFCCKGDGKKDKLLADGLFNGGRLTKGEYHFFDEEGKPLGDYAIGTWDEDLQMTGFGKYYFGKIQNSKETDMKEIIKREENRQRKILMKPVAIAMKAIG